MRPLQRLYTPTTSQRTLLSNEEILCKNNNTKKKRTKEEEEAIIIPLESFGCNRYVGFCTPGRWLDPCSPCNTGCIHLSGGIRSSGKTVRVPQACWSTEGTTPPFAMSRAQSSPSSSRFFKTNQERKPWKIPQVCRVRSRSVMLWTSCSFFYMDTD